jgi:hypothetical protein
LARPRSRTSKATAVLSSLGLIVSVLAVSALLTANVRAAAVEDSSWNVPETASVVEPLDVPSVWGGEAGEDVGGSLDVPSVWGGEAGEDVGGSLEVPSVWGSETGEDVGGSLE